MKEEKENIQRMKDDKENIQRMKDEKENIQRMKDEAPQHIFSFRPKTSAPTIQGVWNWCQSV